jgi:hypothetical protein
VAAISRDSRDKVGEACSLGDSEVDSGQCHPGKSPRLKGRERDAGGGERKQQPGQPGPGLLGFDSEAGGLGKV